MCVCVGVFGGVSRSGEVGVGVGWEGADEGSHVYSALRKGLLASYSLTYAHVCSLMLTYAHVCASIRMYSALQKGVPASYSL